MKADFIGIAYASLMVIAAAGLGTMFNNIDDWYDKRKGSLTPPNIVFPIAWTILYIMIGISLYLAYTSKSPIIVHVAYAVNLVLNVAWCAVFFTMHEVLISCVLIVILWISIVVEIWLVFPHSPLAGKLLIPYLLWVTFATILNFQALSKDIDINKAGGDQYLAKAHKE